MASSSGTTSFAQNSSAVRAIARCSWLRSSGVKMPAGTRSSIRNEPPLMGRLVTCRLRVMPAQWNGDRPGGLTYLLAFEDPRGALSTADAHGDHPVAGAAALHLAQDRGSEFGAVASQRMAERNGAAVDVDPIHIQAGF